jgi:protein transport protein SEC24
MPNSANVMPGTAGNYITPSHASPVHLNPTMNGVPGQQFGPGSPQRPRIDPDHIPSPVAVHEADQALFQNEPYLTMSKMNPPLVTTKFVAVDQGMFS